MWRLYIDWLEQARRFERMNPSLSSAFLQLLDSAEEQLESIEMPTVAIRAFVSESHATETAY